MYSDVRGSVVHIYTLTSFLSLDIGRGTKPATPLGGDRIRWIAVDTSSILVASQHTELVAGAGVECLHDERGLRLLDDGLPVLKAFLQHLNLGHGGRGGLNPLKNANRASACALIYPCLCSRPLRSQRLSHVG